MIGIWTFLLSCSDQNSKKEITGKPIKPITPVQVNWVGHWQNEGYKEQLLFEMAREFEFKNQDIVLKVVFPSKAYSGKNETKFNYEELLKEKTKWDIIRINNDAKGIGDLMGNPEWAKQYLVDFNQYEQFRNNSVESVLSDENKNRWTGIVPGHALDSHSFVLWCNQELAEKIGIKIKQFDITADDLESYLKALHNYNIANRKSIRAFNFVSGWLPTYALGLRLFSSQLDSYEELKNDNYSEKKIKAWENVLNYLEKLSKYEPIDPDWEKKAFGSDYPEILQEKILFVISGTWMYNIFKKIDKVNYSKIIPLELPGFKPSETYIGEISIPWAIPKNAEHREEAIRFMLFWCRPEVADNWVRNTKSPTGIKGSLVQSEFGYDVYETFDYTIKKYDGKKIPLSYNNYSLIFGKNNSQVPTYFKEVLLGSITAQEAMKKIKSQLKKK